MRLITEAESQPSMKPMANYGSERDEVEQLYYILYGVSEPPLAVGLDLCLSLGLDGPVRTDGKRRDLSPGGGSSG